MDLKIQHLVVLVALLFLPQAAMAQGGIELTPFFGYRFGGDFEREGDDFFDDPIDLGLEVEDSESYGLILAVPINRNFHFEAFWSRQESELVDDPGFLDDEIFLFDVDVDYIHGGVLYQWGDGQLRPFVTGSLGGTVFRAAGDDEARFSASLGGGFKVMFNQRAGLRFEARGFSTWIDDDDEVFCNRRYCYRYDDDEYFTQGEVRLGLIIGF